jgi:hypothetical protein
MNVKPIETVEEYRQALVAHDWYFAYSDDYTEYSQARAAIAKATGEQA